MSSRVKWEPKYELGIEEIDNQHKKWIEILNTFIEAREKGKEREVLKNVLQEIVDYTKYHFETEEKHMEENKYEYLESHKKKHKSLVNQVAEIVESVNINEARAIASLEVLLKNWVLKHILTYDKIYGEYLKYKGNS